MTRNVRPVIDLHCHVLAGIDDGPDTLEGSLALARAASECGTRRIVATPHVSFRYPNDAATIDRVLAQTQAALAEAGVVVELVAGAEIAMTRAGELDRTELAALTLGDGPWVLLECPFTPIATGLDTVAYGLEERGYRIVLAHPERCPAFHREPEMLYSLVGAGALTSLTAGSLVGRFGQQVRRFALELFEEELVHNVASDAHDPERRPPSIAAELERAGLSPLLAWLADEVPSAILAGEERMPRRPSVAVATRARSAHAWWRRGPLRRAS